MKLYLFGGAEAHLGEVDPLIKLINKVILDINPKQLLHIPYARTHIPKGEESLWGEGWVKSKLKIGETELLDARKAEDLKRAVNPTIFINGGKDHKVLFDSIVTNHLLYKLVMNADYLIGESAGSMVVGECQRDMRDDIIKIVKGLGILRGTIIEPHYTQRNRHKNLRDEMKEAQADYGIGIDTLTAITIDTDDYPDNYQVIGTGLVEIVRRKDLY